MGPGIRFPFVCSFHREVIYPQKALLGYNECKILSPSRSSHTDERSDLPLTSLSSKRGETPERAEE